MTPLLEEIRHTPLLWLLVLVPVVLLAQLLQPEAHTLLFLLSVAAIIPLAALLFLATIAMLIPSLLAAADNAPSAAFTHSLSVGLSVLLIITYGLGLLFSLKTHRELFAGKDHHASDEKEWPLSLALGTLAA